MIKKLEDVVMGDYIRRPNNEEIIAKINEIVDYINKNTKSKRNKFSNLSTKDIKESMEASERAWKED
jgi:hypothetical protein